MKKKFITIHSNEALKNRAEISFVACNIPNTKENRVKVNKLYGDKDKWYIEYHSYKHDITVVK